METCSECGAQATPELNCKTVFDDFLALEFTDAGYGAVHNLTVTTYMLQHSSKLSREGWLEMRRLLKEFLVGNKSPAEVRRKNKDLVDSGKRKWKISSRDGLRQISMSRWTKTIMNVRRESAEQYCADVTEWAKAALADALQVEPE